MMRQLAMFALCACLIAAATPAQGIQLPEVHRVELDNGVVLLLVEKHDVPLIGFEAAVRGGAVSDPADKAGLASLLAGMLKMGAGERDAAAFAEAVDAVGGSLETSANLETITISGDFLARDADLAIELLTDMLRTPMLSTADMNKLRERQINLIRAAKDGDLRGLTGIYGNAYLFGDHAYGTPVDGDEASLANIGHRDLLNFYRDQVGADRLIIAMAGDFDVEPMIEKLTASFGDWRAAAEPLPEVGPAVAEQGRRVLLIDKPGATQSYFWIGNVGVAVDFPQRAELDIANTLFGGRYTSLLVYEMRTRAGLTYGVRSVLRRHATPGSVAIQSFTKTDTTVEAIDMALALLGQLHEPGFDEATIQSGKSYILGQFPPRLETAAQLAAQFAMLEAAGLDVDYVNAYGAAVAEATVENIRAVIGSVYPLPENLVFVVIGDAELIRDDIAKYGSVTELVITEPRFRP